MQRIILFLKQPFPYFKKEGQLVVLVTLCIFFVLTIVQHFAFDPMNLYLFVGFVGGFTAISAICSVIVVYLFPRLFKQFFQKGEWTRGKYFVFAFILALMIGIVNALYDYIISTRVFYRETSYFNCLYNNLLTAFLIGVAPTVFGYFWMKKQELHSRLQEKEEQNQKLLSRIQAKGDLSPNGERCKEMITLAGNSKDSLTLFPHELFYIESSANYVQVYYKADGQILQKALRSTLQQMAESLSGYPFLVRCHRAFIVNTHQIDRIKGTKVWLKSVEVPLPISKTYSANIQLLLENSSYSSQN